jgi:hypothetical protein
MKRAIRALAILAALGLLGTFGSGCGPGLIEGTDIEATPDNLSVHDAIERYRRAVEERDIEALAGLVSREYFENAGTTDKQDDDYGFERLRERVMPVLRDNIKRVRLEVRLLDIKVQGTRATADFEYFARFLYSEGGKDGWISKSDFNRLEFYREDGGWKIVAGL